MSIHMSIHMLIHVSEHTVEIDSRVWPLNAAAQRQCPGMGCRYLSYFCHYFEDALGQLSEGLGAVSRVSPVEKVSNEMAVAASPFGSGTRPCRSSTSRPWVCVPNVLPSRHGQGAELYSYGLCSYDLGTTILDQGAELYSYGLYSYGLGTTISAW